eukprot:457817-Pelagomonas_calceolata.AAC.1
MAAPAYMGSLAEAKKLPETKPIVNKCQLIPSSSQGADHLNMKGPLTSKLARTSPRIPQNYTSYN